MNGRKGFSLIELLIVVFIIGILIQLTLPAVQASREAARRSSCQNNLRQVGIALQNYESANKYLPIGSYSAYRGSWMMDVLPHMENGAAVEGYVRPPYDPADKQGLKTIRYDAEVNLPLTSRFFPSFTCPSDKSRTNVFPQDSAFHGEVSKHSYVTNHGNTGMSRTGSDIAIREDLSAVKEHNGVRFAGAPFHGGINEDVPKVHVRMAEITDGLSNTLFASEVIQTEDTDLRGVIWCTPTSAFTTYLAPNSTDNDILPKIGGSCVVQLSNGRTNPPCRTRPADIQIFYLAARSRHPGGVNTLMGDGSVHFVEDEIETELWRARSTTQGQD
jgi:prepilin-type N-terminal cleavage/methylation domain-containing protein/prepilin-type processing-associated H-X9-DG protein